MWACPGRLPWSWYQLWADRGLWENRYALLSDEAVLSYDSISAAARLTAYQKLRDEKLATLPGVQRLTSTIVMKRVVDERPCPVAPHS
jgi:hypothetical protein